MKKIITYFIITLLCPFHLMIAQSFMPMPRLLVQGSEVIPIQDDFNIQISGPVSDRVTKSVQTFKWRLARLTNKRIHWLKASDAESMMTISYTLVENLLDVNMQESYSLEVTSDGKIYLKSISDIGILRGLETLLQSVIKSDDYYFPVCQIEDSPRFKWRGLLLDVCRHFMPIETVKRIIAGMSAVKLNVLHWHLSEDQGFRVECKLYPDLHLKGSDGLYYTQEQIREVIEYANLRGIRVVPEFDLPGHATAWLVGHPELASAPGPYEIERFFGVFDPTFNPVSEKTYFFLNGFFGEMAGLFPDEYIHIGGDENNGIQWDNNETIQLFLKDNDIKDNHELQAYFNTRLLKILQGYNKKMIGWDEILQPELPKDILIHSWRGKDFLVEAARQGYSTILSNGYYIDLSQSAMFHYSNDPLALNKELTEDVLGNVWGGEATMWSELVDHENVETRIWPRTAAIAERLWSAQTVKDIPNMYERLFEINDFLELSGSNHRSNREKLVRKLSTPDSYSDLLHFLDWVEPVEGYRRHGSNPRYTSYTAMVKPVDAAYPDAESAVKVWLEYLKWKTSGEEIHRSNVIERLEALEELVTRLQPYAINNPSIKEIVPLLESMKELSQLSREIIQSIGQNKISNDDIVQYKEQIQALSTPVAELEPGLSQWLIKILSDYE